MLVKFLTLGVILLTLCQNSYSVLREYDKNKLRLLMVYKTMKPLDLEGVVVYSSKSRQFRVPKDSLVLSFPKGAALPDTIEIKSSWKLPVYLKLKLKFADQKRMSNVFRYSSEKFVWDVFVEDGEIKVNPKPAGDNFNSRNSLKGFVLILQTALEMIMALLIARIMGWPHIVVLMVLIANVAAYPLYFYGFDNILYRELLVFFVKTIVMSLVGIRKMQVYKVGILAVILTMVSFGFKEILFFIAQIL